MARKKKTPSIDAILEASDNVAAILPQDVLDEIGTEVCESFARDKSSRSDWENRSEEAMKLALQVVETKNYPWDGASNVKYPLLTISAVQFAARVDLFPGPDIVKGKVIGWDETGMKHDRAIRIGKHMTYQLTEQMRDWEDDNDRMFHALPIIGSMFKKSYFCSLKGHNESQLIYPRDLVFDYWAKDVETALRKTHIFHLTQNQIIERQRDGIFLELDLDEDPSVEERNLASEVEGVDSYDDPDAPRKTLEQHRFWDLDGDGYQEPYCITVDYDTQKVHRITPRFEDEDITRKNGEIAKIEPIEYFTQYVFIPDPNGGNLGIGFGHLLGPINESANTLINQLVDAGTLSNLQSGFIGSGLKIKAGINSFSPGEWKQVRASGEDLARNIVPIPVREPSNVLFTLLQLMIQAGERIGGVTDALLGDNPPTNQPATTTLSMIEQGLKVFKQIHKRLYRAFTKEFKKLFYLNRRYMTTKEYFNVLDIPRQQQERLSQITQALQRVQGGKMMVLRDDYKQDDIDVMPSADPSVVTEQERMKKLEILLQTMPVFGWPLEAVKRRFVEELKLDNPDELMQPPPPPPPPEKVQIEQMRIEADQMKLQAEMQLEAAKQEMEQLRMQMEAEMQQIEIQKTQMEIAKLEAEIRQILSETEESDGGEIQLEAAKLQMEKEKMQMELKFKAAELELKKQELQIKAQDMALGRENERMSMTMKKDTDDKKLTEKKASESND
ncbi:MAG: hypothetical protein AB1589_23100 [Cyanobacteriota bacterium]